MEYNLSPLKLEMAWTYPVYSIIDLVKCLKLWTDRINPEQYKDDKLKYFNAQRRLLFMKITYLHRMKLIKF